MRVRVNQDGGLSPPGENCDPHFAEIYVNDGTGVVITTPTAAAPILDAALTLPGPKFGAVVAPTAGSITVSRAGVYKVGFALSEITPVNSQVVTLEVYKNAAAVAAAAGVSPGPRALFTQPSTAVAVPTMASEGFLALAQGDVLTLTVIASTGNFTAKRVRFWLEQITDALLTVTT